MNSTKIATIALWIALPCLIGFSSLVMKNKVQELENELNSINRNIQDDIKTIHENGESRKIAARKNISSYAEQNKELKRLTNARR